MKTILSMILAPIFLVACSKERGEMPENCASVWLISEKYTYDSVFLRKDTLWQQNRLCGAELDKVKAMPKQDYQICNEFMLEKIYYIIKN
jgi:hypothetical protein